VPLQHARLNHREYRVRFPWCRATDPDQRHQSTEKRAKIPMQNHSKQPPVTYRSHSILPTTAMHTNGILRAHRHLTWILTEKSAPTSEWVRPLTNGITGGCSSTNSTHPVCFCQYNMIHPTNQCDYHAVVLPLWSPSIVAIGSVGYLRKPEGKFVTLLNAFNPAGTSSGILVDMPKIHSFGKVSQRIQQQDKLNRVQRGLDVLSGWLSPALGL